MTAKESSVKSLGRETAERPGRGAFQTPPVKDFSHLDESKNFLKPGDICSVFSRAATAG